MLHKDKDIVLEWYSNGYSDFLANSIAMIITQLETAPNANIFYHYSNNDKLCDYKKERFINYLKSKYQQVEVYSNNIKITDWKGESAMITSQGVEIMSESVEISQKIKLDIEQFKEL